MMNEMNEVKVNPIQQIAERLEKKRKNEEYMKSAEYKKFAEDSRNAKNESYTVIYRDTDGTLRESWHCIAEMNIDYVKGKYAKEKKEIIRFVIKELPFGEYLKTI